MSNVQPPASWTRDAAKRRLLLLLLSLLTVHDFLRWPVGDRYSKVVVVKTDEQALTGLAVVNRGQNAVLRLVAFETAFLCFLFYDGV